jgi:hypothetical protein
LPAAIDAVARATLAAVRDGVQSAPSAVARALGPLLLEARRLGSRLGAGTLQAIADVADAAGSVRAKRSELFEALLLDAIASSLVAGYNFDERRAARSNGLSAPCVRCVTRASSRARLWRQACARCCWRTRRQLTRYTRGSLVAERAPAPQRQLFSDHFAADRRPGFFNFFTCRDTTVIDQT